MYFVKELVLLLERRKDVLEQRRLRVQLRLDRRAAKACTTTCCAAAGHAVAQHVDGHRCDHACSLKKGVFIDGHERAKSKSAPRSYRKAPGQPRAIPSLSRRARGPWPSPSVVGSAAVLSLPGMRVSPF